MKRNPKIKGMDLQAGRIVRSAAMRFLLFTLVYAVPAGVFANSDSLYQRGNELYQEGEYEQALESYRKIILSGEESPGLYYNMGNAAYRSNSIGYAILYYEKALKLDPSHGDARHNLDFVSQYVVDTFEEVPEFFLRTWSSMLVKSLTEKSWSILALALFLLLLGSLLIYLFSKRLLLKKSGFFTALVALLLFLVSLLSAISSHRDIIRPDSGIILSPSVVVRSTPSESGTELFILHEGTRVKINEQISGWQNIRVVDGREGWIGAGDFESI